MKRCCTCKAEKALDQYHRDCRTKDGLSARCVECKRQNYLDLKESRPAPSGVKECRDCKKVLPATEFHAAAVNKDGLKRHCKTCQRERFLVYTYGINLARFDALLERQGGRCAICLEDEPKGNGTWHVDHDHSCCPGKRSCGACVRGLLCHYCNVGLGAFKDDIFRLGVAIQYLAA